ncbi:hypothetical protein EX895_004142 [Sporisorium graminicola]|uniref:Uncharacterized protein n=1 Tax=Sporisorium graminicola TaxID=280036 RepID=A0A4U7KR01_9BASI|nr:hypothetical protein EX895_004142 [Sporisorium graminicola]TKY86854.1 hypothetical protein EX895_004142 [Sporisorium graminicola]
MPSSRSANALPGYSEATTSSSSAVPSYFEPVGSARETTSQAIMSGSDSFFDIAPRSDSTSFQVGYLGLKDFQAWIKGDVLVKLDTETKNRGRYTRCIVQLQAKEQVDAGTARSRPSAQQNLVELFSHTLVLWDAHKEATSSTASLPSVPSMMPFSFPLTADLPHCVHLRDSSLTYTITAQLFSDDAKKLPHAIKTVPVHLVRYTRPGPLNRVELGEIDGAALPDQQFTLEPFNWIEQAPTLVYAQINRTIFRRAEPIDIRVRIPSPDPTTITEKGLKLRAVEADLVRIIHVKPDRDGSDSFLRTEPDVHEASDPHVHQALLAHSGKLCRFHSQRPVLLRLTLHPPFDRANMPHPHPDHDALASGPVFGRGGGGGCESISQETLMHRVSFEVRIKIGILGGRGERRDIVLRRAVKILPGAAGALEDLEGNLPAGMDAASEKERLRRSEKARMLEDDNPSASSSRVPDYAHDMLDFGMEDEYDGYEDVGRSLNDLLDAADQSNATGSSSQATDHAERLEQLRQFLEISDPSAHDDGPPPSLLDSRNDLQVEVEVEGVGLAMPRNSQRHPADPFPEMNGSGNDSFPPPPPIDHVHSHSLDSPSPYSLLSLAPDSGAVVPLEHDDPPPPLSPVAERSDARNELHGGIGSGSQSFHVRSGHATHRDPRRALSQDDVFPPHLSPPQPGSEAIYPAYLDLTAQPPSVATTGHGIVESHPSYEAATSGALTQLERDRGGTIHYEPPPYADDANPVDPAPSFDQVIRQGNTAGGASVARGTNSAVNEVQRILPRLSHGDSNLPNSDHHPPAYGTSQHPPSYDA